MRLWSHGLQTTALSRFGLISLIINSHQFLLLILNTVDIKIHSHTLIVFFECNWFFFSQSHKPKRIAPNHMTVLFAPDWPIESAAPNLKVWHGQLNSHFKSSLLDYFSSQKQFYFSCTTFELDPTLFWARSTSAKSNEVSVHLCDKPQWEFSIDTFHFRIFGKERIWKVV